MLVGALTSALVISIVPYWVSLILRLSESKKKKKRNIFKFLFTNTLAFKGASLFAFQKESS